MTTTEKRFYEILTNQLLEFMNERSEDGSMNNNDSIYWISRFRIDRQLAKIILGILADDDKITFEKRNILIKVIPGKVCENKTNSEMVTTEREKQEEIIQEKHL
jgi:hypothetical protein